MRLHPSLLIVFWCVLVALLQRLELAWLLIVAGSVLAIGWYMAARKFAQLLRRTRWIMLSLLVIYAYTSSGQPLVAALGIFSPAKEGLIDGASQLLRLIAALASLALLLDRLHRLDLISGLYTLFRPLKLIRLSRERCAIRLALTLQYAEVAMLRRHAHWQDALHGLFEDHEEKLYPIELPVHPFTVRDTILMMLLGMLIIGLAFK